MGINEFKSGYGYGDYLSDIGNVSQEVRRGMWAYTPHSVDDLIGDDEIDEEFSGGGGTKFTTYNNASGDDFPPYNTWDTSPSIQNNLDANSSLYHENTQYNYDEHDNSYLDERKKAWIPGSQSVEVKQKCKLGGKGDGTSAACNQGDINNLVLNTIKEYFNENQLYEEISSLKELPFLSDIKSVGGNIYSVGGAVRDEFLGKESKDLDVLVTGIPLSELEKILLKYGSVKLVGESFGVFKFVPDGSNEEIDVAIPRTEKPTGGGGHKDFIIKSDHTLPIEDDLIRRDFSINAIAKDINDNIIDPYNGQEDLKNKIIRAISSDTFSDDPLRMLRAVQFASRFEFSIEPQTMRMIKKNLNGIKNIPLERRFVELEKIQKKGDMRYGAQLLKDTGLFKELFGYDLNQSTINNSPFDDVNTIGEFIFLLLQEFEKPEELYKKTISKVIDTYKEIKSLNIGYKSNSNNIIIARSVLHNMYLVYNNSINSNILPDILKNASNDLNGNYPKTVNELALDGNDLKNLGLVRGQIGDTQKKMLINVYGDKVQNNKKDLLNLVNNYMNSGELNEVSFLENKENLPILYSAVILDNSSRERLLRAINLIGIEIPDDWKIIAHHVTIAFGQEIPEKFSKLKNNVGAKIGFMAEKVAMNDKVIAVGVSGVESLNDVPHITIAVNVKEGGKPVMSNDLTNWKPLKRPLRLTGIIKEIPYTGKHKKTSK